MGFPGVVTPTSEAITLLVTGRKKHFSWLRVFLFASDGSKNAPREKGRRRLGQNINALTDL